MDRNNIYNPRIRNDETVVFDIAAEEWLREVTSELRQTTIARYRNLLNTYIYPYFRNVSIERISRSDVEYICSELLATGGKDKRGLSPKTVKDVLSVIKNVLNYASITKNIKIPNLNNIPIKQEHKSMRVFTVSEELRLDRILRYDPNPTNIGILLSLNTGIRLGELCALKWEDINLKERYIDVEETVQRLRVKGKYKTKLFVLDIEGFGAKRKIPIPDSVYDVLEKNKGSKKTYLLTGTERMLDPRTLDNRYKRLLDKMEIPRASFTVLRNTFATRCVEADMDIKTLSEILGHASINITIDRYVHPTMDDKIEELNRIVNLLITK